MNPLSLQELCRFTIRSQIRHSISAQIPDYYTIKREKSTFNVNKKFKSVEETSTEINEGAVNSRDHAFPLTRFERIFAPESSLTVTDNVNFEHQIRLMIYGHLLDAANSTIEAVVNDGIEQLSDEVADEMSAATNSTSHDSYRSFLTDFNMTRSSGEQEASSSDNDSDNDLFDLFAENVRKAGSSSSRQDY